MAITQIRGVTQIMDDTITRAKLFNSSTGGFLESGDLNITNTLENATITGLRMPTNDSDAATKAYVDSMALGLDIHAPCHLATTGPLTTSSGVVYSSTGGTSSTGQFTDAPIVVDGHSVVSGDRILVKDQADPLQNGIYVVTATTTIWNRATDMDGKPLSNGEIAAGDFTFIQYGNTLKNTGWVLQGQGVLTVNSDPLSWVMFSASSATTTLDDAYNNDSGPATITVDAGSINWNVTDNYSFNVNTSGGAGNPILGVSASAGGDSVDVRGAFDVQSGAGNIGLGGSATSGTITIGNASAGEVTIDSGTGISIDSVGAANFSVHGGSDLTLEATSTGADVIVNAGATVDINSTSNTTIDAGGFISLDGVGGSNFTTAGGNLTLATTGSGDVIVNAAAGFDVNASGALTIDGVGTSHITNSAGTLTISTASSGTLVLQSVGALTLKDQYTTTGIALSQSGTTGLVGFETATSIIAALNELKADEPGRTIMGEKPSVTNNNPACGALLHIPATSGSEAVYLNGVRQVKGGSDDYTINYTNGVITFNFNLKTKDIVLVDYKY